MPDETKRIIGMKLHTHLFRHTMAQQFLPKTILIWLDWPNCWAMRF